MKLFNLIPEPLQTLWIFGDSLKATTKNYLNSAMFLDWLCAVAKTYEPLLLHTTFD